MPYIKPNDRSHYEPAINLLVNRLAERDFPAGDINFVITTILKSIMRHRRKSYAEYNALIGVLECVKQEFYRRDVVPYEEGKIIENGDID